ncbi:unnamed protein product, partial [marine sediment metagenome]
SALRLEIESEPVQLDELKREIQKLEIEKQAIKKEGAKKIIIRTSADLVKIGKKTEKVLV